MDKERILVVLGPTASGKTRLAVELAKALDGEIIGADSMQIYKGLELATAQPTMEERKGIPHRLIGFLEPEEKQIFSVAAYAEMARNTINEVAGRGKLPILAGGTGLYINAILDHIQFQDNPTVENEGVSLKKALQEQLEKVGAEAMYERLTAVDPEAAKSIHPNNHYRLIRALEVFESTGIPLSQHKAASRTEESPYKPIAIGVNFHDRELLYQRINQRVEAMMAEGLWESAREILSQNLSPTAAQAIGIKEFTPFLKGEASLEECVEQIKQNTRNYAKRQLTWFRKRQDIAWYYMDEPGGFEKVLENVLKFYRNSLADMI